MIAYSAMMDQLTPTKLFKRTDKEEGLLATAAY
jgi:hypothetical protein